MTEESQRRSVAAGSGDALVTEEEVKCDGFRVLILTLNRPADRNPLDKETIAHLNARLQELSGPDQPAAIIFTGAGAAFSAGGDLKGYQTLFRQPEDLSTFMDNFHQVCDHLERCGPVTVAMVNGACLAGGLELALACDLITMSESARIGDGHMRFSQLPGIGGSQRLIRAIGFARAKYWLLSGKLFTAHDAVAAGLAVESVPAEQLRERTLEIVGEIVEHSPLALIMMKRLIREAADTSLTQGLQAEREAAFDYATGSHDAMEGLMAFAERRAAHYQGH